MKRRLFLAALAAPLVARFRTPPEPPANRLVDLGGVCYAPVPAVQVRLLRHYDPSSDGFLALVDATFGAPGTLEVPRGVESGLVMQVKPGEWKRMTLSLQRSVNDFNSAWAEELTLRPRAR